MEDKPALLKAIEIILADPKEIQKEVYTLSRQYNDKYHDKKIPDEIKNLIAKHIISNYSYFTAFTGAATSLTSVIPGIGQVISMCGGSCTDAALCMKYQIEMTMAIAVVYGHDISIEEEKRLCLIIAGLGVTSESFKKGGKQLGSAAFIKIVRQYLKGGTLTAVKEIFKKIGINFTRKAFEKSLPLGIGVIISATANKTLTWYVGCKAQDFFKVIEEKAA